MKQRVGQLEQEREDAEKLRRRPQLIFAGRDLHIPKSDDRLIVTVVAVIDRLLELEVAPGQIVYVKRLQNNRLLVKFAGDERGSLRDEVYRAKHKLRGHKIFINENLTPIRQDALNMLLHERKEGRVSTVLTRGGEVLFALSRDDRLTRVRNREEAEYLLSLSATHVAAAPPCSALPGGAPAPDRPRSRGPVRAVIAPTDAGALVRGRSAGAGAGPAPLHGVMESGEGPARGRHVARASPLDPPLPGRPGSGPRAAGRGGGGATEESLPEPMETSAARPGSDQSAARPSDLGPPLMGRTDSGGREDRRNTNEDTGGRTRQGAVTAVGGSSEPDGVTSRSVHLDSPQTEIRRRGRELTAGVGESGAGEVTGAVTGGSPGRRRVGRRTSSLPPGQRSGREGHASLGKVRHLPPAEGRDGEEGADLESPHTGSAIQSGRSGEEVSIQEKAAGKSKTGDIRTYLK